eukprot:scaffold127075_cov44-Prasinocladus_malaysianus.AAC.1
MCAKVLVLVLVLVCTRTTSCVIKHRRASAGNWSSYSHSYSEMMGRRAGCAGCRPGRGPGPRPGSIRSQELS